MKELYALKEKLMTELEEYSRMGELSMDALEVVDKLTHTIKNLCKIIEDEQGGGYSQRGYSYVDYPGMSHGERYNRSYGNGMSYDDNMGNSYDNRGRGTYAKRDSMGRYSSADGYSRSGDMKEQIENLMQSADERTRYDLQNILNRMQNM